MTVALDIKVMATLAVDQSKKKEESKIRLKCRSLKVMIFSIQVGERGVLAKVDGMSTMVQFLSFVSLPYIISNSH
jgi:hypothetical protein